jgi:Fe-S-cluster containining protein
VSEHFGPSNIFQCKKCGDCCKGYGGTYVTEKDIIAISDYINTDSESFIDKYCGLSGGRPVLAQGKDEYCVFWDKICTVHPVKPRMCRIWPFIESVLVDPANWEIMAGSCPGIHTDVPDEIIKACVRQVLREMNKS